jgi:hypothetical protein
MGEDQSHDVLATALRRRVLESGVIPAQLREALLAVGAGAAPGVAMPHAALARDIADASYRVTDEQVAAARDAAGSDRAAFEIVMSASIGAGLRRWDSAVRAIREVADATS